MDASNKKGNGLRESGMLRRPDSLKRRNTTPPPPPKKKRSIDPFLVWGKTAFNSQKHTETENTYID